MIWKTWAFRVMCSTPSFASPLFPYIAGVMASSLPLAKLPSFGNDWAKSSPWSRPASVPPEARTRIRYAWSTPRSPPPPAPAILLWADQSPGLMTRPLQQERFWKKLTEVGRNDQTEKQPTLGRVLYRRDILPQLFRRPVSSAAPFSKFLSTATSAAIAVCNAGSASGANSGEWFDGNILPSAVACASFSGSAPPRLK